MLKSVEIKNFRSCCLTKFDFGGSVCAISGRNGAGKTNILNAIDWVSRSIVRPDRIELGVAGNESLDEVSICFQIELNHETYEYRMSVSHAINKQLTEMTEYLNRLDSTGKTHPIFYRRGSNIQITDKSDIIRISQLTPALAALFSLLPAEDVNFRHIATIKSFFENVRYYAFIDNPTAVHYVTSDLYEDWKSRYRSDGEITESVLLRLIYLWQEDQERFDELIQILGPNGLDVLESIEIREMKSVHPTTDRISNLTQNPDSTIYIPMMKPSPQMGGAGRFFSFSELSVGTRKIVAVVVSLLFDKSSLMLVEQPEDSIHTGLLRKLIDIIRMYSFQSQVLFTTHSQEVLDILEPEEVLLATADRGYTKVRKLTDEEVSRAKDFLKYEGSLSDFLEPLDF